MTFINILNISNINILNINIMDITNNKLLKYKNKYLLMGGNPLGNKYNNLDPSTLSKVYKQKYKQLF